MIGKAAKWFKKQLKKERKESGLPVSSIKVSSIKAVLKTVDMQKMIVNRASSIAQTSNQKPLKKTS